MSQNPAAGDGLHTLGRWTTDRSVSTPDRVAIDDRGVRLHYRELERRAAALAAAFGAAGYRAGDRIGTVTGNCADHVVLFFACAKAGLVLVPLSWRLAPAELAAQLQLADPALLVVEHEFDALAAAALELLAEPPRTAAPGPAGVERLLPARTGAIPGPVRPVRDDDPLLMVFTSGTEGPSKAAVLTHANCFWTNLSLSRTMELSSSDVVLSVLPQFHAGGWNIQPLLAWWTGATVVLERHFDAGRVLALIAERGVTTMMGVPSQYLMLAEHPGFAAADLSTLTRAVVGGASMPAPLLRIWHSRGVALSQGYGLTEASPNVLCLPPEDAERMLGYAGKPYPHLEIAVVDPATGARLDGAATGELRVRGPGVFAGYFRDPAATSATLVDGWLCTGDLVERDAEGFVKIVDRIKDLYISGGENVSPAQVEAVLLAHPAVAEAAVVGVPDERWGEIGAAFVVVRASMATDEQDLLEHCAQRLARFKLPGRIEFVPALPRTALNKVARGRLRTRAEAGARW
ncbi:AMP-binding protein [Arthrobacter sp. I2-34]|uniref:AMP-binding protein n=1 Tax=Arthrobacter hankyongi TaxID=2904801 RepID=A0ABS9L855_9MICC|nr:AMP-binding protein [Arthrobacter hankyongi]MCG2622672.1 AMP-binding protein [Arthrobacter hankyongi]